MPKKLVDIKIDEISLVDLPANKRKFLLFKRDSAMKGGGLNMLFETELEKRLSDLASTPILSVINKISQKLTSILERYDEEDEVEKDANAAGEVLTTLRKIASGILSYIVAKAEKPKDYEDYGEAKKSEYGDFMAECMGGGKSMKACTTDWDRKQKKAADADGKDRKDYEEAKKAGKTDKPYEEWKKAKKPPEYYEEDMKKKDQEIAALKAKLDEEKKPMKKDMSEEQFEADFLEMVDVLKVGRQISAKNAELVKTAIGLLQKILGAIEEEDEKDKMKKAMEQFDKSSPEEKEKVLNSVRELIGKVEKLSAQA